MSRMSSPNVWKDYIANELKDPEFAAAYDEAGKEVAFAIALAKAREARGLTQAELAEIVSCKQPQLARYERGQLPNSATLRRLAAALNARITIEPDGGTLVTLA